MTTKQEYILTSEGFLELEEELNDLKINKRPEIIESLKEARAQGDLSENADYSSAKQAQAILEGRIKELEIMIENAVFIDDADKEAVHLGSNITINYGDDDIEEFKLVGSLEANPTKNKISNESPLGKALLNKKVGDKIEVDSPNGSYQVVIEKIS